MEMTEDNIGMVVFDCDGTIVDSQAAIVDIMWSTFESYNLKKPERKEILLGIGLELGAGIQRLLPEENNIDIDELCLVYKQFSSDYRKNQNIGDPLYPDAEQTIRKLHSDKWLLGVATGKSRVGLDYVLNLYGLKEIFVTKQTSDSAAGKPNPEMLQNAMRDTGLDPDSVFMVGDTTYDICMAQNAGTHSIGVSWGYHDAEELLEAGAEVIVHSFEELSQFLNVSRFN